MGPDWKNFVDELLETIENHPTKLSWGKRELVSFIKDRQIQFLERTLKVMDGEKTDWDNLQKRVGGYEKVHRLRKLTDPRRLNERDKV